MRHGAIFAIEKGWTLGYIRGRHRAIFWGKLQTLSLKFTKIQKDVFTSQSSWDKYMLKDISKYKFYGRLRGIKIYCTMYTLCTVAPLLTQLMH